MRVGDLVKYKCYDLEDFEWGIVIRMRSRTACVWFLGEEEPDWVWYKNLEVIGG